RQAREDTDARAELHRRRREPRNAPNRVQVRAVPLLLAAADDRRVDPARAGVDSPPHGTAPAADARPEYRVVNGRGAGLRRGRNGEVLVVIPAFNEERSVGAVVSTVRELGYPTLVVDDGSRDRTSEVAGAAGAVVLRLPVNL